MDSSWLFDLGADVYAWFTAQSAWRASCVSLAEQLQDVQHGTILDLGCGPGVSTFELARYMPQSRLVGLDLAPRMLGEARRRRRQASLPAVTLSWLQADAACVPLQSATVDAATGHSFLYLVADRRKTLSEIKRVLKPGGRLVLMEPNARPISIRQALAVSRDVRHVVSVSLWRPFSRLHGRFSPASLTATLHDAGFENCVVHETLGGLGLLATATAP